MKRLTAALVAAITALAACTHAPPAAAPATPAAAAQRTPGPASTAAAPAEPAAPARLPGEEVLQHQPALPPLKPFDAPVPALTTLPNGLRIYVVERPLDGIEALELVVRRGSAVDPPRLPGVASLTAAMLEAGSAGKSQTEIAAAADAIGADLHVGAGESSTQISISAMPSHLPEMVGLLADVALRPNLSEKEWKLLKGQRAAELLAARSVPAAAAGLAWEAAAYGASPLGRPEDGTPASVKAMSLADIRAFFKTFSPRQAAIVAVGGARSAELIPALTRAFGGWKASRAAGESTAQALARAAPPPADRPRLVAVDFPGKPQSVLRVGQPSAPRSSPDYLPLRLLNSVLGGSFTSRLNQNLREVHGYSYGAASRFAFGVGPTPFLAGANVKTEVTGAALREVLHELGRVTTEPFSGEEIQKGKALLAFSLTQGLEHATTAAGEIAEIFLFDLPLDTYRDFVPQLQALTAQDVLAAAKRNLQPSRMTVAIAGDLKKVQPQLDAEPALQLPAPQLRDAGGEKLPGR